MERARSAPGRAAECCGVVAGAWGAAAVPVPVPAPRGLFGLLPARWVAGLHSSGGAGRHTAGASLAVLRGRGSLSVFLLLLLHLLDDFPDLALCSLAGKEMPDDFNDDLLVLIWGLVSWHDDFCTR